MPIFIAAHISYAEGTDVNILFPCESRMLGQPSVSLPMVPTGQNFSCQLCEESMIPGDVAVTCERAGSGKVKN